MLNVQVGLLFVQFFSHVHSESVDMLAWFTQDDCLGFGEWTQLYYPKVLYYSI